MGGRFRRRIMLVDDEDAENYKSDEDYMRII